MAGQPHSELDTYLVSRLAELQDEAKEENLSISEKSKGDLIKFTQNNTNIKQPHIFLVENGKFPRRVEKRQGRAGGNSISRR
jgi:hypothetical protein